MPLSQDAKLGMAMRFQVVVDDINLGSWATCKGLQVEFKNLLVNEGANYEYQVILPDHLSYSTVTLTRAMTASDSRSVQAYLSRVVSQWYDANSPTDYTAGTAKITLLDAYAAEVASWTLRSVYPKAWKGPELNASGKDFAIETLELIHEGFL
jgi:phage tail-like protein